MGQGEYGGNGSGHYYGTHEKDRSHGHYKHNYHEADEGPEKDGDITLQLIDPDEVKVAGGSNPRVTYNKATRTLTITVPIKHDAATYTEQVRVTWPDCTGVDKEKDAKHREAEAV